MDRETLLNLIANMEAGEMSVRPNSDLSNSDGDDFGVEEVEEAIDELETTIARLRKIIAWAMTAPEINL